MPARDGWITGLRDLARSEQRLRLLALLARAPEPLFHRQILDGLAAEGVAMHPTALSKALKEMEVAKLITGDIEPQYRHGRAIRYTINADQIGEALRAAAHGLNTRLE